MNTTQSFPSVAKCAHRRYGSPVVAKSATGRGNPSNERRTSAPSPLSGVFLRPQQCSMVAVCGQASVWPVSFRTGISTLHTAATQSRGKDGSGSSTKGAVPMRHILTLNPSTASARNKAAAHRAMAIAALYADSSLATRLKRYNAAMAKARALEAQGGAL
ncbi:hypothetical protein GHO39_10070 [Pseudomonas helleri]|uniref:Uncharacterized protein n=2 Tax=Pseudomonas helleri TaxID=1608996 RepID=A0A7X1XDB9_9PSED|nr:ash family protein [Pseudomonas helleri]MQT89475.1 hypothetical protein [Pseudomonas helleri]